MAHLTPPSSKQNTPVRRTDPAEAPVSPTSTSTLNPFRSSGSATLALASPPRQSGDVIDEEEGLDLQAGDAALGGAANEMDIDEEGESESESEDEIDVEDLEEVEGDEGLGSAPEQVQSIEGAKTEDIVEDAKVQTEEVPAGGALAPAALWAKAGGKKKKASRGNRSSKKQKKGKLPNNSRGMYESDIVARWNKDFGDVCSGGPLELPRRQ